MPLTGWYSKKLPVPSPYNLFSSYYSLWVTRASPGVTWMSPGLVVDMSPGAGDRDVRGLVTWLSLGGLPACPLSGNDPPKD